MHILYVRTARFWPIVDGAASDYVLCLLLRTCAIWMWRVSHTHTAINWFNVSTCKILTGNIKYGQYNNLVVSTNNVYCQNKSDLHVCIYTFYYAGDIKNHIHVYSLVMFKPLVYCLNNRSYLKQWLEMSRHMILPLMT